ncbi:MAG: hypothetical protein Kow0029_02590 [Candidatus Rifleibacteriota bacterium]
MANSQTIQQTYDRFSSCYDLIFSPFLESGRAKAIEELNLPRGAKVLEIGIGTGLSLDYFPKHINLTAFDYSFGMLKQSKAKTSGSNTCATNLLQMDVEQMAFADNTFDFVIAAYVLTVVENTEKAVEELFRVARPDAKVVLINHLRSENKILGMIEDFFHPVFSGLGLFTLDKNLVKILKQYGAENLSIKPASFLRLHHIVSFNIPQR